MSEMAISNLDLDKLPKNLQEIKDGERFAESGSDVKVSLLLPDGSQDPQLFKMGTLVIHLKAYVEQKYGHAMKDQVLTLDDHPLLDPLSLSDIKGIKESETNFIKVTTV